MPAWPMAGFVVSQIAPAIRAIDRGIICHHGDTIDDTMGPRFAIQALH
jgi:hypothetical protein